MSTGWRGKLLVIGLLSTSCITLGFAPVLSGRRFPYGLLATQSNEAEADDDAPQDKPSSSWLAGALNKGVFGYEGGIGVCGQGQSSVNNANNAYAAAARAAAARAAARSSFRSKSQATAETGLKLGPAACMSCAKYEDCNFVKLVCPKGHTWRAVPGSPVCFECPECQRSSLASRRRSASRSATAQNTSSSSSSSLSSGSAPRSWTGQRRLIGGLPPESVRTLGELKATAGLQGGKVIAVDIAVGWQRRSLKDGTTPSLKSNSDGDSSSSRSSSRSSNSSNIGSENESHNEEHCSNGDEVASSSSAATSAARDAMAAAAAKAAHLQVDATPVPLEADVLWECQEGHRWTARARNVAKNRWWCPRCAALLRHDKKGRLTLADMQTTASAKGGRCLSPEYLGSAVKLEWECSQGHVFWQSPNKVRKKEGAAWCKECARISKKKAQA